MISKDEAEEGFEVGGRDVGGDDGLGSVDDGDVVQNVAQERRHRAEKQTVCGHLSKINCQGLNFVDRVGLLPSVRAIFREYFCWKNLA